MGKLILVAGSGDFPIQVVLACNKQKMKAVVLAIEGETEKRIELFADEVHWLRLGQIGKFFKKVKELGVNKLMMAGKVKMDHLAKRDILFDWEALGLLKKLTEVKDISIFDAIAERLKQDGVEVIDSTLLLKENIPSQGPVTKRKPSQEELDDITVGKSVGKALASFSIGQTVVVKNKIVIAVEALEGTDETIRRGGAIAGGGVTVVKVSRPNQDMRFDVPIVGLGTLEALKEAKAKALAVEAGKTLIFDKDELIKDAEENKITIYAFGDGPVGATPQPHIL